ncbi:type VII secretion target [Micromonospora sp. NPDC005710]|uniref:WXG100 family type VII secretion target n=1 Tax=Micromonospora sp. NPDC005710 TaxID=3157051 RepID=UPI0033D617C6
MNDGFDVEPDTLTEQGAGIARVAETLQTAWQQLAGQVDGLGDIFGDDDVSSLIAATYQAAHQIAAESFEATVASLHGFGAGLQEMAERYTRVDEEIADGFRQLMR